MYRDIEMSVGMFLLLLVTRAKVQTDAMLYWLIEFIMGCFIP